MELRIPEEGKAVYVGEDEIVFAYYGSEIELRFKTEPPHGDRIYSARLPRLNKDFPFCLYGRNVVFLDAYYLKHRGVKLKNSFDGNSLRLKDIDKLEWIKF